MNSNTSLKRIKKKNTDVKLKKNNKAADERDTTFNLNLKDDLGREDNNSYTHHGGDLQSKYNNKEKNPNRHS